MPLIAPASEIDDRPACVSHNRPAAKQSEEMTYELLADQNKRLVTPGRVELPTFRLGGDCSIHLSYGAHLDATTV